MKEQKKEQKIIEFQPHLEQLSKFIQEFTGVEKGELRPFISQYRPVYKDGQKVLKEDGSAKLEPITMTYKDKEGKEVKQYIAQVSFYKKLSDTQAHKVVVNIFSKYMIEPNEISIIKDKLVKEGLSRFKDTPIKKLAIDEYAKDGKSTKTFTFSTNYAQYELNKQPKEVQKPVATKKAKAKEDDDLGL